MQIAGGAGAGRSLVTAIQKGLVTTFSVCFCSGGLSFGRKSLQGTLPCEHGEGGKDPGEQRTPRSSSAGQGRGAAPSRGELEVSFASGTAPAEQRDPRCPRHPCPRLELSLPADGRCGRAGSQARGEAGGSLSPRGVSGTSGPLPAVPAGLGPGLEPQAASGGCRHSRPRSGSAAPSPGAARRGLPAAPQPLLPRLSPAGSGGRQPTRALQPLDGPRLPVGFFPSRRIKVLSKY